MKHSVLAVLAASIILSSTPALAEGTGTGSVTLTMKDGRTVVVPIGKDGYIPHVLEDGAIRISKELVLLPTKEVDENGNVVFITMPYAAYAAHKKAEKAND